MNPQIIRTAIILMKRAPLKGDEARDAALAIAAFERIYDRLTTPPETDKSDDTPTTE